MDHCRDGFKAATSHPAHARCPSQNVTCAPPPTCQIGTGCVNTTGVCSYIMAARGTTCTDGSGLTLNDTCDGSGNCTGLQDLCASNPCAVPTQCVVNVTCVGWSGACVWNNITDGTPCTGGDDTVTSTCQRGYCISRSKCAGVTCNTSNPCAPGRCEPTTGVCTPNVQPDTTACTDSDGKQSICVNATCIPARDPCDSIDCSTPPDTCHVAGTCTAGTCSYPVKDDGQACNDGNATTIDTCVAGKCTGTPKCAGVVCKSLGQCYGAASCVPSTGAW